MAEDSADNISEAGSKGPAIIISIPSAASSVQESNDNTNKVHYGSSSEEESDEETIDNYEEYDKPEVLLKRTRKQARRSSGDDTVRDRVRCVALTRIIYGDCHWQLAKAYSKLAQAYYAAGMALQALGHASNARDILVDADGLSHQQRQQFHRKDIVPIIERTYLIMGQAYLMLKQYQKAENALKKAQVVSKERSSLSKELRHTERAIKIGISLGKTAIKLGKSGYALECLEKALEQAQEEYGSNSRQLIQIYQNIGQAELHQGSGESSKERALEAYLKAHSIAKEKYKSDCSELADSSMALASIYCLFNDDYQQSKAKELLQSAYEIHKTCEGPYSTKTIKAQEELCHLLIRNSSIDESIKLLKDLLSSKLIAYGDPSEQAANVHQLLGSIYLKKGRMDYALQHFSSCKTMLSCVLGPNHRKTKKIQTTIDVIKRAPSAKNFATSDEKLKERPRFAQVVGRSKPLGSTGIITD